MRIGFGIDYHRLVPKRRLILGGVEIPYDKGLLGHSDADVLVHSICDALLGAAALGDIGKHFPDTDERFKDISSLILLQYVVELLSKSGYVIENIDSTIVAQEPKLAPYIEEMKINISDACNIMPEALNIKATTSEGLDDVGKGLGIKAYAVCLIKEVDQ